MRALVLALLVAVSPCWASGSRDFNADTNRLESSTVPSSVEDVPATISFWVNPDTTGDNDAIAGICVSNSTTQMFWGRSAGTQGIGVVSRTTTNAAANCATCSPPAGTWFHGANVWVGTADRSVFFNGGDEGNNTTTKNLTGTRNLVRVGSRCNSGDGASSEFNGQIGPVSFWGVALSNEYVQELSSGIAANFVDPSNLLGFYPLMETGNAQTAVDWSQELNDLTATGTDGIATGPPWWWAGMTN